jgi:hypothetical protein
LNSLFAQCAADAACNAAYPKLDHAYDAVVARLNANPARSRSSIHRLSKW